jgi:hypothetical protein
MSITRRRVKFVMLAQCRVFACRTRRYLPADDVSNQIEFAFRYQPRQAGPERDLNDEGKGQIDESNVVLEIGHGGSAGKTAYAADGFPGTWQNASVCTVPKDHPGDVD